MAENVISKKNRRYREDQIRNMRINPYVDGSPFEAYPMLQELRDAAEELKGLPSINWDQYVIFLSLAYDPYSPLQKDHSGNMPVILEEAAKLTGLNIEHTAHYKDITHLFLQSILKSQLWAEICAYDSLFWRYIRRLGEPPKFTAAGKEDTSADDELKEIERQGKMASFMSDFRKKTAELRKEFYGGDKELAEEFAVSDYSPEGESRRARAARV